MQTLYCHYTIKIETRQTLNSNIEPDPISKPWQLAYVLVQHGLQTLSMSSFCILQQLLTLAIQFTLNFLHVIGCG